jgi:hypothetical protein
MNSLMIFLPVAICGLIAVAAGFHYAGIERRRMRALQHHQHPEYSEPYLPFPEITHSR